MRAGRGVVHAIPRKKLLFSPVAQQCDLHHGVVLHMRKPVSADILHVEFIVRHLLPQRGRHEREAHDSLDVRIQKGELFQGNKRLFHFQHIEAPSRQIFDGDFPIRLIEGVISAAAEDEVDHLARLHVRLASDLVQFEVQRIVHLAEEIIVVRLCDVDLAAVLPDAVGVDRTALQL